MPRDSREKPLVLLVDDDAMMRLLAESSLEQGGFDVVCAEGGAEALALFEERRPDAVLLDVMMPEIDGFEVCSRIRKLAAGTTVPVLMMTALDDLLSIERAYEQGATDFVTKPISYNLLAHRVRYLLRSSKAFLEVRQSARRFARAQRLARLVQWELDPETKSFRWSEGSRDVFSGLQGEAHLRYSLLRWVHPKDRARVEDALGRAEAHRLEYRLVLASGEERVVHQEAEIDRDAATGHVRIIGTAQDVTELRAAERQVAHLNYYDSLTDLPNRAHACRFLDSSLLEAKRSDKGVSIIALDLDLFRRVNDSVGHVAGNALLQEVAGRIRGVVHGAASALGRAEAMAARLGDDEFVVILRNVGSPDHATSLFRAIADRIAEPYLVEGSEVVVSCSAGIATYPEHGTDVDTLLAHADAAMHVAKERGGKSCQIFTAEIQEKLERRLSIETRLRGALVTGRGLELHYQPKVEVTTGAVRGVEALLRWTANDGPPIAPQELVAVAEETGLIVALGDWVLRAACVQAKEWADGARPLRMAVNISAHEFKDGAEFAERVAKTLAETGLAPELLELEITEGVLMVDTAATARLLSALKAIGVHIALDDFGTGYSSLAYLTRLPIDTLKIDRSFVKELGVSPKSEAIVLAIVTLAQNLELSVVAEGVETEEQRSFLERCGPLAIQGWLYARAMPGGALREWIVAREDARSSEVAIAPLRAVS